MNGGQGDGEGRPRRLRLLSHKPSLVSPPSSQALYSLWRTWPGCRYFSSKVFPYSGNLPRSGSCIRPISILSSDRGVPRRLIRSLVIDSLSDPVSSCWAAHSRPVAATPHVERRRTRRFRRAVLSLIPGFASSRLAGKVHLSLIKLPRAFLRRPRLRACLGTRRVDVPLPRLQLR